MLLVVDVMRAEMERQSAGGHAPEAPLGVLPMGWIDCAGLGCT
jgi:hypothetical protein